MIMMIVPGADDMQFYQPTHKLAYDLQIESLAGFAAFVLVSERVRRARSDK